MPHGYNTPAMPPSSSSSSSCSVQCDQSTQPNSPSKAHVTKVEELWFDDGNVIIQAGSSLYRVFRGILGARSNVFKHMFESCVVPPPSPSNSSSEHDNPSGRVLNTEREKEEEIRAATEMMDDVPFVKLLDDERDVTAFLRAVFDSSYFEPYPWGKPTFATITGVLRLSHKYDVDYLRKRALHHLNQAYPNTLTRWDMLRRGKISIGYERMDSELFEAYIIIQLAFETQADWLIPAAVYKCCTYPIESILELETKMAQAGFGGLYFTTGTTGISAAQQLCLTTWPKICASYHALYGHLLTSCTNWSQCQMQLKDRVKTYSRLASTLDKKNDPLDCLDDQYLENLEHRCSYCSIESVQFYEKWRRDLWMELPRMMGLQRWQMLNKMAEEQSMSTLAT